jgi:alkylhydroperoxidase family enzyme
MLRWLINKRLNAAEKKLGVPIDYMRHIAKMSLPAFFKFVRFMPLAEYRKKLPVEAYHLARLVAVQKEDCGTCVQIEINLAQHDGVSTNWLQAALEGKLETLPRELANVCRFTEAVVTQRDDMELREAMRQQYGEEGLVELALAIAACRVFPTTKRALGYATSCSRVKVYY